MCIVHLVQIRLPVWITPHTIMFWFFFCSHRMDECSDSSKSSFIPTKLKQMNFILSLKFTIHQLLLFLTLRLAYFKIGVENEMWIINNVYRTLVLPVSPWTFFVAINFTFRFILAHFDGGYRFLIMTVIFEQVEYSNWKLSLSHAYHAQVLLLINFLFNFFQSFSILYLLFSLQILINFYEFYTLRTKRLI